MRAAAYSNGNTVMGPGTPLVPVDEQPVRMFDFQVAQNTILTPRSTEAWTFKQLRAFSNVEPVRLAIERRKDQMERLDWQVKVKGTRLTSAEHKSAIAAVEKYLAYPDKQNDFATWARLLFEDLLSIDAPTIERVRTGSGKIYSHDVIDGSTIKVLIDETGRIPSGEFDLAYQQIIKGRVWNNLTNSELLYLPRNKRPGHIYGSSAVEWIVITIKTILQRQALQLAHFTDSNIPAGLLTAPDTWNPDQIKKYQTWFDRKITGQLDQRAKIVVAPAGVGYEAFKDAPLKDEFDEWLYRIAMYAFSLPPTPFIKQMNRATSAADQERSEEEGLEPLKRWFKRVMDRIIQLDLEQPELEFAFIDNNEADPKTQSEIDDKNMRNGSCTIDEARAGRGKDPLPNGMGAKPMIYTSSGVMTLEQALESAELTAKASAAALEATTNPDAKPGDKTDTKAAPDEAGDNAPSDDEGEQQDTPSK